MRSALTGGVAALALGLSLTGCDEFRRMTGQEPPAANTTTTTTTTSNTGTATGPALSGSEGTPAKPVTADPTLAAEMQVAAAQLQRQLPIRADQITTVTAIRAEGTEFVYDLTISQPIPAAQLEMLRQTVQRTNQANMCVNPQVATFIRRGGSMNHRYSDTAGNRFETRVVSCP